MWTIVDLPDAYQHWVAPNPVLFKTEPAMMLQVIPLDAVGFHEAFNIRVDELQVLSMEFLYDCPRPTVALLYQDNKDVRHLRTYEMSLKDKVSLFCCDFPPGVCAHRPKQEQLGIQASLSPFSDARMSIVTLCAAGKAHKLQLRCIYTRAPRGLSHD